MREAIAMIGIWTSLAIAWIPIYTLTHDVQLAATLLVALPFLGHILFFALTTGNIEVRTKKTLYASYCVSGIIGTVILIAITPLTSMNKKVCLLVQFYCSDGPLFHTAHLKVVAAGFITLVATLLTSMVVTMVCTFLYSTFRRFQS